MEVNDAGSSGTSSSPKPPHPTSPSLPAHIPSDSEPPPTGLTTSGRPQRNHQLPARYRDMVPEPLIPLERPPENRAPLPRVILIVRDRLRTAANSFGLLREYLHRPSFNPDAFVPTSSLATIPTSTMTLNDATSDSTAPPNTNSIYKNESTKLIIEWQNSGGSSKSNAEVNRLVQEVLLNPNFKAQDLRGFKAGQENRRIDAADKQSSFLDSFQETSVDIEIPSGSKDIPSQIFSVPGLHYRKITSIIRSAFSSPLATKFHLSPFKLFHRHPLTNKEERVFCEVYDSDAFIEEHDQVQRAPISPDEPECKLEKFVAALMFWSDSTHLTNFGTAKLWPIYLLFGNLSKYLRTEPSLGACQHLAYIPSLPDSFQDFASKFHIKWGTQRREILTHCRRELMHAVWRFLLDNSFIHAYKYGMVIMCSDGIQRRVYPRIFTYLKRDQAHRRDQRPIKPVQNQLKPVWTENRKNRLKPVKTGRIPEYFVGMNCSLIYYLNFKPLIVKNGQEINIICYFL